MAKVKYRRATPGSGVIGHQRAYARRRLVVGLYSAANRTQETAEAFAAQ